MFALLNWNYESSLPAEFLLLCTVLYDFAPSLCPFSRSWSSSSDYKSFWPLLTFYGCAPSNPFFLSLIFPRLLRPGAWRSPSKPKPFYSLSVTCLLSLKTSILVDSCEFALKSRKTISHWRSRLRSHLIYSCCFRSSVAVGILSFKNPPLAEGPRLLFFWRALRNCLKTNERFRLALCPPRWPRPPFPARPPPPERASDLAIRLKSYGTIKVSGSPPVSLYFDFATFPFD